MASQMKVFDLTVLESELLDVDAVRLAKDSLELSYQDGSVFDKDSVTKDLMLMTNDGTYNVVIYWTSSDSSVVGTTFGTVRRPRNGSGNQSVQLTAYLYKGLEYKEKVFDLTVIEMSVSDTDAVRAEKNNQLSLPRWFSLFASCDKKP